MIFGNSIEAIRRPCEIIREARHIMTERFGKDKVISLATVSRNIPNVRNVNAYYEDGVLYIITYALSNEIKHIEQNSTVAIAGDWFTAHGKGINLGYGGNALNHISVCPVQTMDIKEKIFMILTTEDRYCCNFTVPFCRYHSK